MRAAPPVQVTLVRFGAWRGALALLAAAAAAALSAWLGGGRWSALAAAAAALISLRATRRAPQRLSWDGECWRLGAAASLAEPAPGTLHAMIDLDGFLLLRFRADADGATAWLPAQRRGHEAAWHALRCAVYSPRPAAASVAPDDSSPFPPA